LMTHCARFIKACSLFLFVSFDYKRRFPSFKCWSWRWSPRSLEGNKKNYPYFSFQCIL
jgi:hypothetical protein